MTDSKIEWTDKTWNPVRGCSVVSPGCQRCYAMKQAHRFSGKGGSYEGLTILTNGGPVWSGKIHLAEDKLEEPLHWKKPARVFVNSMSDLFHEDVPFEYIDKVFAVMALCPQHTFQILTKRPARMLQYFISFRDPSAHRRGFNTYGWVFGLLGRGTSDNEISAMCSTPMGLSNVWLGVSVESQKYADERIPLLLKTPAAVRWISAEPLLEPINLEELQGASGRYVNTLSNAGVALGAEIAITLDWVVCGGESGDGARPFDLEWARDIKDQCMWAGVPFFMKQAGANVYDSSLTASGRSETVRYRDHKGGDMSEWPSDLRVREYPVVRP